MKPVKLTAKQEAFCLAYLETGNASEAYRQVYKSDRMKSTTTGMFCGAVAMEWLFQRFSDKDFSLGLAHWISFALAVALFNELINKRQEKKMQEDENALVVAAGCEDLQTAEDICNKLERNGIKTLIVDKDSPVYIKGNSSPVQIQVCRKDLEKSKAII